MITKRIIQFNLAHNRLRQNLILPQNLEHLGICSGMFKCCTVHVQMNTVKIELQRILKVPRTAGAYTRLTTSEGIVQLGWNVLEAETSPTRRNRPPNEECIAVYTVVRKRN